MTTLAGPEAWQMCLKGFCSVGLMLFNNAEKASKGGLGKGGPTQRKLMGFLWSAWITQSQNRSLPTIYIGIMENRMETTILYWVYIGRMEKKKESCIPGVTTKQNETWSSVVKHNTRKHPESVHCSTENFQKPYIN